jgi:ribosomal protein L40E
MSGKTVLTFGLGLAMLVATMNLGCSSSSSPTTQPAAAPYANGPATTTTPPVVSASSDDPFHVAKPTADLEGTPTPQTTPSPEAIVTNKKTCPECGTPNAVNATKCVKCGHKFD